MDLRDEKIAKLLLEAGIIDEMQHSSLQAWHEKWGGRAHHIAVEHNFAREDQVAEVISRAFNVPRVKLSERQPERSALDRLDSSFCEEHGIIPMALRDEGKTLWLLTHDPSDVALLDQVRARAHVVRVTPAVAGYNEILEAIQRHYGGGVFTAAPRFSDGIDLSPGDAGEEFKVVDMSGKTLVKHEQGVQQLREELRQQPLGGGGGFAAISSDAFAKPADDGTGAFADSGLMSTATPLDELEQLPDPQADAMELVRRIRNNMEQTNQALRYVVETCIQQGIFTLDEYRSKLES